ncbi:MAG: tetratricopeptide repeat protein, partial [Elusimicrobia bacterium]|nr:tetratricopeptide repeat protein [Elusimicrobiota bacterium]
AYREILASDPKGPGAAIAHLRIAQAAFNAKDDAAAIKQIQELVAGFPAAPEANDGLDILEGVFDRNRELDYKASLRQIVTSQPGTPIGGEAQFRLARRAFESKDWASAAADFQKFSVDFTNHPELPKAQFYLGESRFNQSKWQDSIPAFERLLNNFEKSEDTPLAVFHLASAYYNLEKFDEATRHYSRLIEEYPSSPYVPPAQFNLALAYKKLGKLDMAQYAYQKYIAAAKPGDAQAQNALWETYQIQRDRKDYDGAVATLETIKNTGKADGELALEVMYRISEVNTAAGRPDEAQATWENMRTMKPLGSAFRLQALAKLGEAYEKAGDPSSAADVYEDYARAAPKDLARKAAERAAILRKSPGGAKTKKAAPRASPNVDDRVAPEGGRTMVMPSDEPPEKKPASKKAAKSAARGRRGATEPNLPGMPAAEDIQ